MDKFIDILRAIRDTLYPDIVSKHTEVVAKVEELQTMSVTATTLPNDQSATVSYDPITGILSFGIPTGVIGVDGLSAYEVAVNNGFLGTQNQWLSSLVGDTGATGRGIVSVTRTTGDGSAGTIDTYTILYSDATTSTFGVYNGANGTGVGDMIGSNNLSELTSVSDARTKLDVYSKAESDALTPTLSWINISGKPSTYPPETHNHDTVYEAKNANIQSHIGSTSNPHGVTANQVLPSQTGNSGKVLSTDGTNSSWTDPIGGGATGGGADTVFVETSYTVTQNYTLTAGKSAITVGDANGNVTIADGVTITIPDNSAWVVQGS